MKISNTKYGVILSVPGLMLLLIWVLVPFSYVFYLSFLRYDNISPVTFTGFDNYIRVLTNSYLLPTLKRTFIFSFGSTGLTLLISLILALCLNKIVRGSTFFRSLNNAMGGTFNSLRLFVGLDVPPLFWSNQ